MKISYNWLKQFIKIDLKSEETAAILTDLGLEVEVVEKYQSVRGGLEGVVVGHVLSCEKHPDADRLSITKVDLGAGNPGRQPDAGLTCAGDLGYSAEPGSETYSIVP